MNFFHVPDRGTVVKLEVQSVFVNFENGVTKEIKYMQFEEFDPSKGKTLAVREQLPLLAAYAMTIHKCQGMTLDSAVVNCRYVCYNALTGVFFFSHKAKVSLVHHNKQIISSYDQDHTYFRNIRVPGMLGVAIGRVRTPESLQVMHFDASCCRPQPDSLQLFVATYGSPYTETLECCHGACYIDDLQTPVMLPDATEVEHLEDPFDGFSEEQLATIARIFTPHDHLPTMDLNHPVHLVVDKILTKAFVKDDHDIWDKSSPGNQASFFQEVWDSLQAGVSATLDVKKPKAQHETAAMSTFFKYVTGKLLLR